MGYERGEMDALLDTEESFNITGDSERLSSLIVSLRLICVSSTRRRMRELVQAQLGPNTVRGRAPAYRRLLLVQL